MHYNILLLKEWDSVECNLNRESNENNVKNSVGTGGGVDRNEICCVSFEIRLNSVFGKRDSPCKLYVICALWSSTCTTAHWCALLQHQQRVKLIFLNGFILLSKIHFFHCDSHCKSSDILYYLFPTNHLCRAKPIINVSTDKWSMFIKAWYVSSGLSDIC